MPFLYVTQAGMDAETTGSLIEKIQEERKMTQAQLAEMVHVSDNTISKWENGVSQS